MRRTTGCCTRENQDDASAPRTTTRVSASAAPALTNADVRDVAGGKRDKGLLGLPDLHQRPGSLPHREDKMDLTVAIDAVVPVVVPVADTIDEVPGRPLSFLTVHAEFHRIVLREDPAEDEVDLIAAVVSAAAADRHERDVGLAVGGNQRRDRLGFFRL